MDKETTTPKVVDGRGGKREGAGRLKGGQNAATITRKKAEAALQLTIMERAGEILSNQLQLSRGHSYLFRIDTNGKGQKQKPVLVKDEQEIIDYLSRLEETEDKAEAKPDSHYYITTEKPDNQAIVSMLDRAFGKAVSRTELTGKDGADIMEKVKVITVTKPDGAEQKENENTTEADTETIPSVETA